MSKTEFDNAEINFSQLSVKSHRSKRTQKETETKRKTSVQREATFISNQCVANWLQSVGMHSSIVNERKGLDEP